MRYASPAPRHNLGRGVSAPYAIDPEWRSEQTRCCRFCGQYDEGLLKFGKRAYAHERCFEHKYGSIYDLKQVKY